ncbi:AfsR/SARP family transcriptional regulator [Pseudonocardia abyssalis]|jgi:DNA-binding SARP family transcriptional activator|uniref:Tetratricopeptide repeat protein n=1 Tax=Pseudonocardia abyssalis TaxID=2792008 RepID=A0ABS6UPA2_9PSEU|nr:BTAD domain-containing putative transcriptional regulator [Pseudonocardia abyssalis]MBW0115377.1 tetratricopeptide repeat protein [Pseudonocardia abyssalis]MBW0134079.1 tetratricopeptide repeat protein [Pseudonocardia abyssalis]
MPAGTTVPHRVTVLGSFTLHSHSVGVPLGVDARRVVAYLAVHPRPQRRGALAVDLWPGVPVGSAMRLLDDAVLAVDVPGLLVTDADGALSLSADVEVDLAEAMLLLRTLPEVAAVEDPDLALLGADILPGWTASWLVIERERFRQLRLHAVEERSLRLTAAGHFDGAIALAQSAVRSAPSRETARRALIEAHLAQGNISAAVAEYDEYQELLRTSVGAAPAFSLDSLLPPTPAWPVMRARSVMPRSAVQLPGLRSVRASGTTRRLVAGGSVPGTFR